MDKDYGIGHCRLHRVQLSPLKRNIARMGGSRHRVFQGILQVLYKIACLLVAAAILFCILSYLVF